MLALTRLLPFRGSMHVMFAKKFMSKRYTFVVLFGTIWGSVHLPCHSDVTQDDLWTMLKEMEDTIINLRRRHRTSRIVIGSDLNVSLAPSRAGLTGTRIHPDVNNASSRWREAVIEWMHSLRLRALCTFEQSSAVSLPCVEWDRDCSWTHRNANGGGHFQLDYMLVSESVLGAASVVRGGYHLNSDHWPIDACLQLEQRELWGAISHDDFTQRGWAPKNDVEKRRFMKGVADDLCWMQGKAKGKALTIVEELVYSHAVSIDSDNAALRQWGVLQDHRTRLAELRSILRQEVDREVRKSLRRDIRRELTAKLRMVKGRQLDRMMSGYFDRGKETLEMQLPDGPSDDRHAWAAAAGVYGHEVYCDDDNDTDSQLQRLAHLQKLAQREMSRGWQPPLVKFHDFLNAMASAKAYKQPGGDGVVVEMVRALSWPTLLWIYLLFLARLGGWETERPEAWREVTMAAIPKKSDKVGFRAMRYISLLPVLQKLYIRAIQTAARRERKPHQTNILGFEPRRSTAGVTGTLRQVLSKAAEWGVGALVASADVEGAFDGIRHDDIAQALLQKGMHPGTVCSLLRESFDLQGRICLPGAPISPEFSYSRGTRQGSVEGPDFWNQVLDNALRTSVACWEREKIGFHLAKDYRKTQKRRRGTSGTPVDDGKVLHHICWADDLYAMAGTTEHLTRILKDMTNAIEKLGLRWKKKSLNIVAGPYSELKPGDTVQITSDMGQCWTWLVVAGMEALGTWLDSRGCSEASMWHRVSKGNSLFYAKKSLMCDPKVPVKKRIQAFYSTCAAAVLHGSGEWAYTQSMFQALRLWELGKLRRVLCLRRRTNESWVDHMKRTGPIVARQLKKHGQARLQSLAMRRVQTAAWQAMHSPDDAMGRRYWEESVAWRCDDDWREAYKSLTREDHRNTTKWKRPHPGRSSYWERPFTRLLGDAWITKIKACGSLAEWRSLTKGLENCWHAMLSLKPPDLPSLSCDAPVQREKRPREDSSPWIVEWSHDEHRRLEILGDSRAVICWLNGMWEVKDDEHANTVRGVVDQFVRWYMSGTFRPRTNEAQWSRHIYREHNTFADTHANWLMDNGDSGPGAQWEVPDLCKRLQEARNVLLSFDGARRGSGLGAAAWILWVRDKNGVYEKVSHGGRVLMGNSAMVAEREAVSMGVERLASLMPIESRLLNFEIETSGRTVQYKLDTQSLRPFGHHWGT